MTTAAPVPLGNAQRLRRLIDSGTPVQAPGAADPLTARLVEQAGFAAVYMTGFGVTAARLGVPDLGILTQSEMADAARAMTRAVDIPVIADADNGYGGPSNIERTVHEYIQADVAALHLEDQTSPKRCGQMAGVQLMEEERAERHIRAAVSARADRDMLIIGRTDALGVEGLDVALDRAKRYRDAGADLLFVDGVKTLAQAEEIGRRLEGPKVIALITGTEAANLTLDEARELGFSIVLHPLDALFAATAAAASALATLRADGFSNAAAQFSYDDFMGVVGLEHHQGLDDNYGS
ncbi:2-methylisocitrate lyase-like PEP mutase family enzyme [Homoserinimonas aerilata]|uniref:2-methylisocitrate lyase-like PEP mutase family enzyme n=1 Tax=Homoserinimonas aerilata TaxID=1162970 RepID=A0A542YFA0_9MICO|nr:isocitrate lyase/PEP mutase family protein [Homoserinimonas aerilata]TQL46759.1 2-methylisocitrate lyase-like PEP mutase family enzyme [Homoserinimonas aerilata]